MSASSVNSSLTSLTPNPHPHVHPHSMGMNHLNHPSAHHTAVSVHQLQSHYSSQNNGPTSPGVDPIEMNHNSTTPVPTQSSSDGDIKTEDGQEIACVVCGDKSSGKHYGQFTCEGKTLLQLFGGWVPLEIKIYITMRRNLPKLSSVLMF